MIMSSRGVQKVQVNVLMPIQWKEKLEEIARETSVRENKNISYQDLIRAALVKKYKLPAE